MTGTVMLGSDSVEILRADSDLRRVVFDDIAFV
jgi:hypothetical protein